MKILFYFIYIIGLLVWAPVSYAKDTNPSPSKPMECKKTVSLADIVSKPEQWIDQSICFSGIFESYSDLGLDHPTVERPHTEYVTFIVSRPDTNIPLSELKLFVPIKIIESHSKEVSKIKKGSQITFQGKPFATILGEPWVDVLSIKLTQ